MSAACPHPIDWLYALEADELPPALRTHLSACPSCREVKRCLEPLRGATSAPDFSLLSIPQAGGRWSERTGTDPQPGTLCLTTSSFDRHGCSYSGIDRLLVLMLTKPDEEFGSRWLEAVPVDTEVESAGPVDGMLGPSDSTLDIPLRLRFGLQVRLSTDQIASEVGQLSDSATVRLSRLIAGDMESIAFGSPYVHASDWRRDLDPEAARIVATLSQAYDAAIENNLSAQTEDVGDRLRALARRLVGPASAPATRAALDALATAFGDWGPDRLAPAPARSSAVQGRGSSERPELGRSSGELTSAALAEFGLSEVYEYRATAGTEAGAVSIAVNFTPLADSEPMVVDALLVSSKADEVIARERVGGTRRVRRATFRDLPLDALDWGSVRVELAQAETEHDD